MNKTKVMPYVLMILIATGIPWVIWVTSRIQVLEVKLSDNLTASTIVRLQVLQETNKEFERVRSEISDLRLTIANKP